MAYVLFLVTSIFLQPGLLQQILLLWLAVLVLQATSIRILCWMRVGQARTRLSLCWAQRVVHYIVSAVIMILL